MWTRTVLLLVFLAVVVPLALLLGIHLGRRGCSRQCCREPPKPSPRPRWPLRTGCIQPTSVPSSTRMWARRSWRPCRLGARNTPAVTMPS